MATTLSFSPRDDPEEMPELAAGLPERTARALDLMTESIYFSALDRRELVKLAATSVPRLYAASEIICHRGEPCPGLHMVASGLLDVFLTNSAGRERVIYQVGPGHIVGASVLVQDETYPCWIRAKKPSETVFLPKAGVLELIDSNHVAMALMESMAKRLYLFYELIEFSGERVMPRLASFLLGLPEEDGRARLPTSKNQLAMRLGTTPESLSRAFTRLRTAGVIELDGRRLLINDRRRLSAVVADGDLFP